MSLLLCSCSFFKRPEVDSTEILNRTNNKWFSKNPNHALFDTNGLPQSHPFFDIDPEFSKSKSQVNVFILTPTGSTNSFDLDLSSGQRFYKNTYCSQKDVWKNYSGEIEQPDYSTAILPRFLDQLGGPQKVIVLGSSVKFNQFTDHYEHRVRLVGSFVEQLCLTGNCLGKNNWISRLVFLAVDPKDKKFSNVIDLKTLKSKINWIKVKATLENIGGRNDGTAEGYPAVRINNPIELKPTFDYYEKNSIYLSDSELNKIVSGCHKLYDKLWSEVGKFQVQDLPSIDTDQLKSKLKLIEELKKNQLPVNFSDRFKIFIRKYFSEFNTCQKIVYAGNINKDSDAFWFLSYISIFSKLHHDGFYFDCRTKSWKKNVRDTEGKLIFNYKKDFAGCTDRDFDLAFAYLENYLKGLRAGDKFFYRFVDYDTHAFGTHQKMYSWVKVESPKFQCRIDPNTDIKNKIELMPEEGHWKNRDNKNLEEEMKIIY
jgi:hypothetical protein